MYTHKYYESLVRQKEHFEMAKIKLSKEQLEAERWARPATHASFRVCKTPRSVNRALDGMSAAVNRVSIEKSEFGRWDRRRGGNRIVPGTNAKVLKVIEPINSSAFRAQVKKPFLEIADPAEDKLEAFAESSGFSRLRVEQLQRIFFAGASKSSGRINSRAFDRIFFELGMQPQLLSMLFTALLKRGAEPTLGFEDFIHSLKVLIHGTRQEQVLMIFKMIDVSCDRRLTKLELLKFFTSDVTARVNKKITAELVNEMMRLIDTDHNQEVTMREFEEALAIEEVWVVFQAINPLQKFAERFATADLSLLKAAMFREPIDFKNM